MVLATHKCYHIHIDSVCACALVCVCVHAFVCVVISVGTMLQYYHHYAILGFAIFIIASIVNIASLYMSVFLE